MTHVLAGLSITLLLFVVMQWMVEPERPENSGYQTVSVRAPKVNEALAGTATDNNRPESHLKKVPDSLPRPGFTPSFSAASSLRSGVSGSLFAPPDARSLLSSLEAPGLAGKSGSNTPTINPDALPSGQPGSGLSASGRESRSKWLGENTFYRNRTGNR